MTKLRASVGASAGVSAESVAESAKSVGRLLRCLRKRGEKLREKAVGLGERLKRLERLGGLMRLKRLKRLIKN